MSRLHCVIAAAIVASAGWVSSATMADDRTAPLSLTWRLVASGTEKGYQAELTIHNHGTTALAEDWALCFNSSSRIATDSLPPTFRLSHVNGDFYILRPGDGAAPIEPGEACTIPWTGTPWAINVSDTPAGFYLIRNDRPDLSRELIPIPLHIADFPTLNQLKRGAADVYPVATHESRYSENEPLKLLPADSLVPVVPTPVQIKRLPGHYVIRASTTIHYEPPLAGEAQFLAAALERILGTAPTLVSSATARALARGGIRLRVADLEVAGLARRTGDESYSLIVGPEHGVEIVGSDPAGVFYGVQSLRALLPVEAYRAPASELPVGAVRIADAPRFPYRGLHLDVARNFHSKETVKKLLELMAFYKLNRFHWHLTDDEGWRVEIKQLPELAQFGGRRGHTEDEAEYLVPSYGSGPFADSTSSSGNGYYTQADFIDILRFAHLRHITIIPELDFPGHARAAVKAMEAHHRRLSVSDQPNADDFLLRDPDDPSQYESVQMWRDNVADVGREAIYRFLNVVVGELAHMYRQAGAPLTDIHLGGDEVPAGAWSESASSAQIETAANSKIPRRGQLEIHFLNKASEIVRRRSIRPACWEDCLSLELDDDQAAAGARRIAGHPAPTAYVWNNVWGWGREDAAYRLANAGFDVVLCNATHLYFDLACEKDPHEPGYYWAGFVGMRAPFEFVPFDVFKNAARNSMGQSIARESLANRVRLTPQGARHIRGIQGQLWGENLRSAKSLQYMAFPRVIALAERAWAASPAWAEIDDPHDFQRQLASDWNQFANRLGQRELPRLDYLEGGVHYRIPPPGAVARDGLVEANVAIPGLAIRYTTDGSEPTANDNLYHEPLPGADAVRLRAFDTRGRGSRTVIVPARSSEARADK